MYEVFKVKKKKSNKYKKLEHYIIELYITYVKNKSQNVYNIFNKLPTYLRH